MQRKGVMETWTIVALQSSQYESIIITMPSSPQSPRFLQRKRGPTTRLGSMKNTSSLRSTDSAGMTYKENPVMIVFPWG
jgi:hypothetical protein